VVFARFEVGASQLAASSAARPRAVVRPRSLLARNRSLPLHNLRGLSVGFAILVCQALSVPRGRRPPSLPAYGPCDHVMLGACNRPAFAVGLRLTQRSSGYPTAANVLCALPSPVAPLAAAYLHVRRLSPHHEGHSKRMQSRSHSKRWHGSLRGTLVAHEPKDRSVSADALAESPCQLGRSLAASVCRLAALHTILGRSVRAARPASLAVGVTS
jgi:hypothetical protein